jgi:hypothetical protein
MQRRTRKIVCEELEAAELEYDSLRVEAKQLFEQAKAAKASDVGNRCKVLTDKPNGLCWQAKNRIQHLRAELEQIEDWERRIVMERHPSAMVYQSTYTGDRVLPTNGIMPGDGRPRYSPYNRIGKLRAFKDEQTAFDSGMWMRAVLCREFRHSIDSQAEDYCKSIGLEIANTAYEGSGPAGSQLLAIDFIFAIAKREFGGVVEFEHSAFMVHGNNAI